MHLTFQDEFNRLDLAKWNDMDSTYLDTNGVENVFRAANVSVSGGALRLLARREANGTVTSGLVMTGRTIGGRVTFKTGQGFVEVRARFPAAAGAWPAIWMNNPGDGSVPAWPAGGEIDIAEFYGDHPSAVESNYHWEDGGAHRDAGAGTHPVRNVTGWHTYGVGIHPDRLEYYYDGIRVRTITATTSGHAPRAVVRALDRPEPRDRRERRPSTPATAPAAHRCRTPRTSTTSGSGSRERRDRASAARAADRAAGT